MATEKPVYVYLSIPPLPVHQSPWRFLFFVPFFPWEKKVKFLLTTERVALYIGWWLRVNQQSVMMIIPLRERESICFGLLGRNRLAGSIEKGLSWEREGEGGRRKVNDNDIMRAIGPGAPGLLPDDYILPPSPGEEEEEREKLLSRRVYTSFRLCLIRHRKTTNQVEGMRRTLPPPLLLLLLLFPQMIHNCYIFFSLLSLSLCFRYMCENREKCQGWDIFRPDAHSCVLAAAAPRRSIKNTTTWRKRERENIKRVTWAKPNERGDLHLVPTGIACAGWSWMTRERDADVRHTKTCFSFSFINFDFQFFFSCLHGLVVFRLFKKIELLLDIGGTHTHTPGCSSERGSRWSRSSPSCRFFFLLRCQNGDGDDLVMSITSRQTPQMKHLWKGWRSWLQIFVGKEKVLPAGCCGRHAGCCLARGFRKLLFSKKNKKKRKSFHLFCRRRDACAISNRAESI